MDVGSHKYGFQRLLKGINYINVKGSNVKKKFFTTQSGVRYLVKLELPSLNLPKQNMFQKFLTAKHSAS